MSAEQKIVWSGKPYIKKTIAKAIVIYFLSLLILIWLFITFPPLFFAYTFFAAIFVLFYILWKRAHTYYVTDRSVLITRSWVFGTYQRDNIRQNTGYTCPAGAHSEAVQVR